MPLLQETIEAKVFKVSSASAIENSTKVFTKFTAFCISSDDETSVWTNVALVCVLKCILDSLAMSGMESLELPLRGSRIMDPVSPMEYQIVWQKAG